MGDFRIVIDAIGGHGQDREKKDGEVVDFYKGGNYTPEAMAKFFIEFVTRWNLVSDVKAKIIHWPADNYGGPEKNGRDPEKQIEDDLITGIRKGNF